MRNKAIAAVLFLTAGFSGTAAAAAPGISPEVHRQLEGARDALAAGRNEAAMAAARAVLARKSLGALEGATARILLGQALAAAGTLEPAVAELRKAYESPAVEARQKTALALDLGKLLLRLDQAKEALTFLSDFERASTTKSRDEWLILASAHARAGQLDMAVSFAKQAAAVTGEHGGNARANGDIKTEKFLISLLVRSGADREALERSLAATERFPLEAYFWQQAADLQQKFGDLSGVLKTLATMKRLGHLDSVSDHLALASLHMSAGVPYRAVEVLRSVLAEDLEADARLAAMRRLADALTLAREWRQAAEVLQGLAREDMRDGRHAERLGDVLVQDQRWKDAAAAYDLSLAQVERLGDAEAKRGPLFMKLGIARFKAGQTEEAREAFETAAADEAMVAKVMPWLNRLPEAELPADGAEGAP